MSKATETDYRALITSLLLVITGVICFYGMLIGWPVTDVLAILAFFGPMVMAAVQYYFLSKQIQRIESQFAKTMVQEALLVLDAVKPEKTA